VQFADKVLDKLIGMPSEPVVKSPCCSHDGMILEHSADRAQARRFSSDCYVARSIRVAGFWCLVVAFPLANTRDRRLMADVSRDLK